LAWAILLLFHPTGAGQLYPELRDKVTRWEIVHVGAMIFIPLMAVAVYLLLRGIENTAAQVSRIALALFALFYTAWEVLLGIGLGVVTSHMLTQFDPPTRIRWTELLVTVPEAGYDLVPAARHGADRSQRVGRATVSASSSLRWRVARGTQGCRRIAQRIRRPVEGS
jgi:hypothetical protein